MNVDDGRFGTSMMELEGQSETDESGGVMKGELRGWEWNVWLAVLLDKWFIIFIAREHGEDTEERKRERDNRSDRSKFD